VTPHSRFGRLCVITDPQFRFNHEQLARLACAGGAGMIQFRDKRLPDGEFARAALLARDACWEHAVPIIINDRAEIARDVRADGVHLGRGDMTVAKARTMLGDEAIIGMSAGSAEEAREAEDAGADYVGFGHIFATSSKAKTSPPVGLEALASACAAVKIPVIAVGGINEGNAGDVIRAGAWGIAVISAVCGAADPFAATARLRAVIDASLP
jgi:thiamine-phosphate pyrophosphorylase